MSSDSGTPTPRTDAAICKREHIPNVWGFKEHDRVNEFVSADFARTIERALHAAEQRATQAEQSLAQERAARERAEGDARRYRWLRDQVEMKDEGKFGGCWMARVCVSLQCDPPSVSPLSDKEQLDAAIKEALAQEGGKP